MLINVEARMNRDAAESLARLVQSAGLDTAEVVPDGTFFVVEVVRLRAGSPDTYTLYDDTDWAWLRERITN